MSSFLPAEQQLDILSQGIDVIVPEDELSARLGEGRPLRVKLGVDPTAPDVTLGWAVVFRLLRRFQELGHVAVLIIGDFTARVGDPSGQSQTRRRLDEAEVDGYASQLLDTVKELLLPEPLEIQPNSRWLGAMDMADVLEMTSKVTVARIMDRDDFSKRWANHQPISLIEFMYPLLQAMDSVAVRSDVEIGGSDQLFNLLLGRDVQERHGQPPQVAMTTPLLVGTDGVKKMSQSFGNYISVRDEPADMFGKTMSIPDAAMKEWFVLAADRRDVEADEIQSELDAGIRHPGDTKRQLAREVVALYWGEQAAVEAEQAFDRVFREKRAPQDVATLTISGEGRQALPALLEEAGLVKSRSEARRLIDQGAVKIDGIPTSDEHFEPAELSNKTIQVGKRRFVRFELDS